MTTDGDCIQPAASHGWPHWASDRHVVWAVVVALVFLGVLARANRYLQGWSPWGDETALVDNVIERDYRRLLEPLDGHQVAPVGYLWLAKTCSLLFGINEHSLRLPAFVFSIAALLAVVYVAATSLRGWEAAFAVAVIAVSNFHVRHAAEMKQYAVECGVSAVLIALAFAAFRGRLWAAWLLAAVTPFAMFLSLTTAFVAGGIGLALLPTAIGRRSRRWWAWWIVNNLVIAMSFSAIYLLVLRPQLAAHHAVMAWHWSEEIPKWESAGSMVKWLWRSATGSTFAHPLGGENGDSIPFAILFWIGVVASCRRRDWFCVRLIASVFGFALLAALLGKFPFGGHPRLVLYLSPLVAPAMGVGLAALLRWRMPNVEIAPIRLAAALAVFVAIGLGGLLKDCAKPYFNPYTQNLAQFAKWLWTDYEATSHGRLARVALAGTPLVGPREHPYLHARYNRNPATLPAIPARIDEPTGLVLCTVDRGEWTKNLQDWRTAVANRFEVFDHDVFWVNRNSKDPAVRFDVLWVRAKSKESPTSLRIEAIGNRPRNPRRQ